MAIAMLAIASTGVITEVALIYIIAAWALITGVFEIFSAVRLRKHIRGEWLLALSGFASLTLGTSIVALPIAGASAIAIWIGLYAFVFGGLPVELGLRLRRGAADVYA